MSIRRVRGSFRGSLRKYGSVEHGKKSLQTKQSSWVYRNGQWHLEYEDGDVINLMVSKYERIPMKDFAAEVRASVDVEQFMESAVLHLDTHESGLEGLVDVLLKETLAQDEPNVSLEEAKSVIFTQDSVHLLTRTIQGTNSNESGTSSDYDQSWICAIANLPSLQRRHVAIARLRHPSNMGSTCHEVRLFVLVLCPSKEKGTKNALETGRTFATLFADIDFRQTLLEAPTTQEFKRLLEKQARDLAEEQAKVDRRSMEANHMGVIQAPPGQDDWEEDDRWFVFGRDILDDLARRVPYYISDYTDGLENAKTIQKVISTTFFLYFACILPAIAFGVLNDHNTHGKIDVKKVIIGQTIGGLAWVIFSGQPLMVQLTTAPLAIYIKVIYSICEDFELDFYAMYCCVGLWNSFFLILYSLFGMSRLMRWSTRSTEEIFALFISVAFCVDAFRDAAKDFREHYFSQACINPEGYFANLSSRLPAYSANLSSSQSLPENLTTSLSLLVSDDSSTADDSSPPVGVFATMSIRGGLLPDGEIIGCHRESSMLFLLLMLGTVWVGVSLYNFNKTPYLQASKREALADYALPVAVLLLSFVGSYIFISVPLEHFKYDDSIALRLGRIENLSTPAIFGAMGLGFTLSLLFFMDQNITSAMVNNPCNKLKKGPAYHWDLFVVALFNGVLSLLGLPWMHAMIPHSPLHAKALADVETRVIEGHTQDVIIHVRETRLSSLFCQILIGLSLFMLPYPLRYIPPPVLYGLFLYMGITALDGNQFWERILLIVTEQALYPPNHYIRRVPQRTIHIFTSCQFLQFAVLCAAGFSPWPYTKMAFPVILLCLLPIRHLILPKFIEKKHMDAMDAPL